MASLDPKPSRTPGPPSVINAGLFRTGTASMAEAYRILGLRPHHGLDLLELPEHWAILERAADATWPSPSSSSSSTGGSRAKAPQPFTRADWDDIFGSYDAVTDVGSAFAVQLAAAYPDSRVVVVRRDPERWARSFEAQLIAPIWGPLAHFLVYAVLPLLGNRGLVAMRKILLGMWDARNANELRDKAVEGYEKYYESVRAAVPEERRLEYRLGSGWEPLCEFLDVQVPDVPFPWVNEALEHKRKQQEQADYMLNLAWRRVRPWVFVSAGAGASILAWRFAR
ncbi:hypothetical protein F5Y19DRAFT_403929 [Xylariaceae sp. FL1651]|nr:hypothetical protein F5Y19DRAFT_403929 [Xylariaceae sp. FL1651]